MSPPASAATEVTLDPERETRIGLDEAVLAAAKTSAQLRHILESAASAGAAMLLTRLAAHKLEPLPGTLRTALDYCEVSQTAIFGRPRPVAERARVALVCAGSSDVAALREAERTLRYYGEPASLFADVGVAGLWRLTARLEEIRTYPVVIVAAGMDAALPSVLGGLVGSLIIGLPTSVGYGVAAGGRTALDAMLASCAPGICVVNIDNGYGAACAALRALRAARTAGMH